MPNCHLLEFRTRRPHTNSRKRRMQQWRTWSSFSTNMAYASASRVALLLLVAAPAFAQKGVKFSWTPGANPGWTVCASGNYCLTGYTLYETTSGALVAIASIPQADSSYVLSPLPSAGTHTYELAQDGISGGAPVQSTGNPGAVVNCKKHVTWRSCSVGKVW